MSTVYGYCRISKPKQNIERQIRNIKEYAPEAVIVEEAYSGMTTARPKWNRLYNMAKEGDTIIFDSVSRMSRNAEEGFRAYDDLFRRGVDLIFLKEPLINTSVFKGALKTAVPLTGTNVDLIINGVNAFLLEIAREQIRLAFDQAEKEVQDIRQRTREGIETARLAGKQIGRETGTKITTKKSIAAKKVILNHNRAFGGELTDYETMVLAGISKNAFYKYKAQLKEESSKSPQNAF